MRLYLVEGLNCSGKTTYINKCVKEAENHDLFYDVFTTPWANPLRWKKDLFTIKRSFSAAEINSYAFGVYETLLRIYFSRNLLLDFIFWDRTWISAYVYGSINYDKFLELIYLYKEYLSNNNISSVNIIFMDTSAEVCKERWNNINKLEKNYVDNIDNWDKYYVKFLEAMEQLENCGYFVERINE